MNREDVETTTSNRGESYPHARFRSFFIRVAYRSNAIGLLIEEDDVGNVANFGAFVADVFFDVEDCGGVFL